MKNWMIAQILDNLEVIGDRKIYTFEAGNIIFESASYDGSYTCSKQEARDWIHLYASDLAEFLEQECFDFVNPIIYPEQFQVQVMLIYANVIMQEVFKEILVAHEDELYVDDSILNKIRDILKSMLE